MSVLSDYVKVIFDFALRHSPLLVLMFPTLIVLVAFISANLKIKERIYYPTMVVLLLGFVTFIPVAAYRFVKLGNRWPEAINDVLDKGLSITLILEVGTLLLVLRFFAFVIDRKSWTESSSLGTFSQTIGATTFIYSIFAISSTIIELIINYQDAILSILNSKLSILPCCITGILLYRLRGQAPLLYGALEIVISIVAIWLSVNSPASGLAAKTIGLSGGIYIMVRGLDNVDRGLPIRYRTRWTKIFPKRQSL